MGSTALHTITDFAAGGICTLLWPQIHTDFVKLKNKENYIQLLDMVDGSEARTLLKVYENEGLGLEENIPLNSSSGPPANTVEGKELPALSPETAPAPSPPATSSAEPPSIPAVQEGLIII